MSQDRQTEIQTSCKTGAPQQCQQQPAAVAGRLAGTCEERQWKGRVGLYARGSGQHEADHLPVPEQSQRSCLRRAKGAWFHARQSRSALCQRLFDKAGSGRAERNKAGGDHSRPRLLLCCPASGRARAPNRSGRCHACAAHDHPGGAPTSRLLSATARSCATTHRLTSTSLRQVCRRPAAQQAARIFLRHGRSHRPDPRLGRPANSGGDGK